MTSLLINKTFELLQIKIYYTMKTLSIKTIIVLFICTTLFLSCSNNSDDDSPGGSDEFLTAKIEGVNFSASTSPATIIGATISNGVLAVQGGDNSGNTISFQVFGYNGTGTYKTGDALTSTNQIMYITINPVATWGSSGVTSITGISPGIIEITSEDGITIEGTFSFEGYNADDMSTKNITEGKFKAELQ